MAFAQDLLTRIINISGGGVVFLYAECLGNKVHYVKFKSSKDNNPVIETVLLPEPESQDPLPSAPTPQFGIRGSTFALVVVGDADQPQPVFLINGLSGVPRPGTFSQTNSRIYYSNDGLAWTRVFEKSNPPSDQGINASGLVWDPAEKKFYMNHANHVRQSEFNTIVMDEIFGSPDGSDWSMVSSVNNGLAPNFVSPFSTIHCAHNNCLDEWGRHVPDGVHWQKGNNDQIVVRPTKPAVVNYVQGGVGLEQGPGHVEIVDAEGRSTKISVPGIGHVACAAAAGGVLMAGGVVPETLPDDSHINYEQAPGAAAFSLDGGMTWQMLGGTPVGVLTMIAGPMQPPPPPPSRA